MNPISFERHRFPASVIVQAVRWSFRLTLSIRDGAVSPMTTRLRWLHQESVHAP